MDGIKKCRKCRVDYCTEEFYARTDRDSLSSWCRFCITEMHRANGKALREQRKKLFNSGELKPISEKWCILCDDVKPWQEFYMKWDAKDLLSHYCRMCHVSDDTKRKRRQRNISNARSS